MVLPHEEAISTRSSRQGQVPDTVRTYISQHSISIMEDDGETAEKPVRRSQQPNNTMDEEKGACSRKDNIYIDSTSIHSIRHTMKIASSSKHSTDSSSIYSPQTCSICCEAYRKGDEIAWSRNEECLHAYHVKCILEWLMENDDCPMCRSNYLCSETPLKPTFPIAIPLVTRSSI